MDEIKKARELLHAMLKAPYGLGGTVGHVVCAEITRGRLESAWLPVLAAALRSAQVPEWRPIETAPKDGTDILIAGGTYSMRGHCDMPYTGPCIAFWDRDHWHGNEANAHDEWASHEPTHWMPLPAAPSAEGVERG